MSLRETTRLLSMVEPLDPVQRRVEAPYLNGCSKLASWKVVPSLL